MKKKFLTGCVRCEQVKSLYEISSPFNVLCELFLVGVTWFEFCREVTWITCTDAGMGQVDWFCKGATLPLFRTWEPLKASLLCTSIKGGGKKKINSLYCQISFLSEFPLHSCTVGAPRGEGA